MDFPVAGVTVSPLVPFGWALFTGVVFSMVGAAGGILAAVGHISVLGIYIGFGYTFGGIVHAWLGFRIV